MLRHLLPVLAAIALLTGCSTRESRRDLTWEQGGYADPGGVASMGQERPVHRRAERPGS